MTLYIGLDGEMTSSEIQDGGKLIQIGMATRHERFTSLIGWPEGSYAVNDVSMAVHGITVEQISAAPPATVVDDMLYEWLIARGADPDARGRTETVGWNQMAFDLPFVADALPKVMTLLARRGVDLNAVVRTYAEAKITFEGNQLRWSTWKKLAHRKAAAILTAEGYPEAWHDAGYDAHSAIVAWEWLLERIQSRP